MRFPGTLAALLAALFVVAGCSEDEHANGSLTCEEAWSAVVHAVETTWDDPHTCESDRDCVVDSGQLGECAPGVHLALCGWVVHRDSVEAFRDHVRETAEPICSAVHPPASCGPACPAIEPACTGGTCIDAAARDR